MRSEEFKSLVEKYVRGECTPQEEKLINEWYENIETSEEETAPLLSEMSDEYKQVLENRIWSKVNPHPPASVREGVATKRSAWYYPSRVAAAAIILVTSTLLIVHYTADEEAVEQTIQTSQDITPAEDGQEHIVNDGTKPISVQLADGSTVTLQPRSEIIFKKSFDEAMRTVRLSGEAFFDVHRDEKRPFRVYSEEIVTQVLGTSFTVKAYQNEKEVTVAVRTGKVFVFAEHHEIKQKKEKPIVLAPNQQAVYDRNKNKVVREVVDNPAIILPKSELFKMSFEETPVTTIFEVLEQNYGIDIVYDKDTLSKCTLTTAMSDEGLFERIKVICKAIQAEYRVEDGVILIDSPGCE